MVEFISLIAFLLIAFTIGSNDTSNSFGICIGCRIISVRRASILLFVLVLLGAIAQGDRVVKTVGKDLITTSSQISEVALIVSAMLIVTTNIRGIPVSTHQVIIGSLFGAGIAFGVPVNVETLSWIFLSWLFSPFISGFLAILLFILFEKLFRNVLKMEKFLRFLMICPATLIAYNMGANELATAMAPIAGSGEYYLIALFGAFSVSVGALALSGRIAETLCKGITSLDPKSGLSAHLGAGITVYIFTLLGMPVSTTYSLIGGIASIGLLKGVKTVKYTTLKKIGLSWIFSLLSAFILSFSLSKLYVGA